MDWIVKYWDERLQYWIIFDMFETEEEAVKVCLLFKEQEGIRAEYWGEDWDVDKHCRGK